MPLPHSLHVLLTFSDVYILFPMRAAPVIDIDSSSFKTIPPSMNRSGIGI